ncbi:MAG TPA: CbbQ/NirQ/NorQ/GpvN family protein [Polyangiaceae bacterium]|nr:CbbQ/NirQ/NorQ/GpvN family protein [Polyangiaceae bacterium]
MALPGVSLNLTSRGTETAASGPLDGYRVSHEPYYRAIGDEVALFEAAYAARLPVILKGPTGSGKTRFVEYMAYRLGLPLVTVACNEDMTASDLVGRKLLDASGTHFQDGPLTLAARFGAICYLDEVVEARPDATVVIHPLCDDRRILPIERNSEVVHAHPSFFLVLSYNPGYQSVLKDLKQSTKQRFGALEFDYPPRDVEVAILRHESGIAESLCERLVNVAERARALKGHGLDEGTSTRMLVRTALLVARGIDVRTACRMCLVHPIADDPDVREALSAAIDACL